MKTIDIFLILTTFFLVGLVSASAIIMPMPISGKLNGDYVSGLTVTVENMRTHKTLSATTTQAGEFLVDWSNSDDEGGSITRLRNGDIIKFTIEECKSNSECVKSFEYTGSDIVHVNIPLETVVICPKCDDWTKMGAGAVLGLIIALMAFMGGGLKIYKNRLGNIQVLHKHKGIKAYHDPNVKHTNPMYRHTPWKEDAMKCVKDVKKIEEQGGLI